MLQAPPLSLYIHIPWCVQKCPYCDFNSHGVKAAIPEREYISHLLDDLSQEAALVGDRPVTSIFFGGGTPSLFSPEGIASIIQGVGAHLNLTADAEITLEANPGTAEAEKFTGFSQAGINRLSIGVQSFQPKHLNLLGRIHDDAQAHSAAQYAKNAGLSNFNLDLMHGLPDQTLEQALSDLQQAIEQAPPHLSWYQLTIEPNTLFYSKPPPLPEDDLLWVIQEQGAALLAESGYQQYEISGYARKGQACQHNLNYWRFGDYLGIGCGAHGKITLPEQGKIVRRVKVKHPKGYMDLTRRYLDKQWQVEPKDMAFEFFMNRFRLLEPCPIDEYARFTGQEVSTAVASALQQSVDKGLLLEAPGTWQVSELGRRYLNTLLEMFV